MVSWGSPFFFFVFIRERSNGGHFDYYFQSLYLVTAKSTFTTGWIRLKKKAQANASWFASWAGSRYLRNLQKQTECTICASVVTASLSLFDAYIGIHGTVPRPVRNLCWILESSWKQLMLCGVKRSYLALLPYDATDRGGPKKVAQSFWSFHISKRLSETANWQSMPKQIKTKSGTNSLACKHVCESISDSWDTPIKSWVNVKMVLEHVDKLRVIDGVAQFGAGKHRFLSGSIKTRACPNGWLKLFVMP